MIQWTEQCIYGCLTDAVFEIASVEMFHESLMTLIISIKSSSSPAVFIIFNWLKGGHRF
jgi:hypothetical protein